MELFRAAIAHTPANPFRSPEGFAAYADGALAVQNGRIVACGDYAGIRARWPEAVAHDWRGGFLLPGFVDTHTHFPQLRIIGRRGLPLLDWLDQIALPEEARMADMQYATAVARDFVGALAANGTTTALVFGAHFAGATAALFEAARAGGLRIVSGLVMSDRRLRPDLHQRVEEAYSEAVSLIRCFHQQDRLLYAVTPRFALSASETMLEVCGTLMREHPDVRFQTHLNENTVEIDECARLFPWAKDYLAVYERFGLSGPRAIMAHDVHPTTSELSRLAASGTTIAHCPASNAALGSGLFPMRRHLAAGVRVALGTDIGAGSGVGMLKEMREARATQSTAPDPEALDVPRLLYLATRAGAEALQLESTIGDFQAGKAADFVYVRPPAASELASALTRAGSLIEQLDALIALGGAESVREVRVEGRPVYEAG